MPRILVVEDEVKVARALCEGLAHEGHTVALCLDGDEACERARRDAFDAAVLDVMLPGRSGLAVLAILRDVQPATRTLLLTARDAIEDRVQGLDAGADDYLVKPFAFAELVARIGALTRRAGGPRWAPANELPITMRDDLVVEAGGKTAPLSPREYALLGCLLRRPGEVVTRVEILREAFGYDFDPGTNVIDVHLTHLRKKLAGFPVAIETVRGAGIRLTVSA